MEPVAAHPHASPRATVRLELVRQDTRCPICWGTIARCKAVIPCLYRFCTRCIEDHLRKV
jgi:hypothetical protein